MKKALSVMGILALLLVSGCSKELALEFKGTGEGLFVDGCPVPGKSIAKLITNPELRMEGPDALGGQGDYLLMNEHAAFIIQGVDHIKTYYYYGGTPIDAVALEGCSQAGPERFEEMGLAVGLFDLNNPLDATLRAFRGYSVEVINDGSDGQAAVVRVYGTDDFFWLIELELIGMLSAEYNLPKSLSDTMELDIYIDYILPPDSSALQIETNIHNTSDEVKEILSGAALFFGDTSIDPIELKKYHQQLQNAEGLLGLLLDDVPVGVPWMVASRGDGAWSFAMKDANLGMGHISGVTAALDADQILEGSIPLAPDGQDGDTVTSTYFFSVGGGDHNTALLPLHDVNPNPAGLTYSLTNLEGIAYDQLTGDPLPNAQIEIQVENLDGDWVFLTGFISDENGLYGGMIPDLGVECQLIAHLEGRPSPPPVYFFPSDTINIIDAAFIPGGLLQYDVRDSTDNNIPAKILVWESGKLIRRIYSTTGYGDVELAPNDYWVTVTRGYEYTTYGGPATIHSNSATSLEVSIERVVNTIGFLSVDTHMHAGPSADNYISIPDRIASVASEGLEVAVSTDHEFVGSWQSGIDETGLWQWVATVVGQEVTTPIPGHMNIYGGIEPRYDINARGGPVEWWEPEPFVGYSMDTVQVFAAERARGARVIQINHPRDTGMTLFVDYDPVIGQPLAEPSDLGFPEDGILWDWDFDAYELMNGMDDVFEKFGEGGTFDDWMSFLNFGHRVTALGASDVHNYGWPGYPRNYFVSPTDKPTGFEEEYLVKAVLEGRVVISTGAFARVAIVDEKGATLAEMGDTYSIAGGGPVSLRVHIEAIPEVDVTDFMVFVNCDLASGPLTTTAPDSVVKYNGIISVPVPSDTDAHIVVLGFGENSLPLGFRNASNVVPRFVTNAIYIDTDNTGTGTYDNFPGSKECYSPY
ncbi:MAG: CehA/McbA family metallohydrolase [Deltaproteobacteria bacterium]|nr:MAG: CehA/McbA family metallohydrolase [Deltaproteobacteria bacterium]